MGALKRHKTKFRRWCGEAVEVDPLLIHEPESSYYFCISVIVLISHDLVFLLNSST
jgi:hypothetical protein